jgi:hypothetical protein
MKKRANVAKLRIKRETLRSLTIEAAKLAAGGNDSTQGSGFTCMNGTCGDCTTYMFSCGCGGSCETCP